MLSAYKELAEFGIGNIFLIILLILIFAVAIMETLKKLPALFNFETKAMIKERELNETIKNLEKRIDDNSKDIEALQGSAKQFKEDRVHDREQSFEKQGCIDKRIDGVQTNLTDMITSVVETQREIIKKVDDLTEANRKYELADIRETLLQAYRYYTSPATNPTMSWTSMECHTFMEQYQNYIDRKGNSHMQEVVYPAMRKLIEIPMHEYDAIAELMESRHRQKK